MTYDAGVGGDDHEGVEREDGDGAPGEGGAGNLRRRHHCSRQGNNSFQPGQFKQKIPSFYALFRKIELNCQRNPRGEMRTRAGPERRRPPAGAAGAGTRGRHGELGRQGPLPRAGRGRRAEQGAGGTRLRPLPQRQRQREADLQRTRDRAVQPIALGD